MKKWNLCMPKLYKTKENYDNIKNFDTLSRNLEVLSKLIYYTFK